MFKDKDRVIVIRGKSRGPAIVIGDEQDGEYPVQTEAGKYAVVHKDNLKALPDATVTSEEVARCLDYAYSDARDGDLRAVEIIDALVSRLSASLPDLAQQIKRAYPDS